MAGPFNASTFDPEQPQRFYLPDEEMERLADATLIVEGMRLPVHSAVLSLQSRVLRGLFVEMAGADTTGGRKRKQPDEPVVLEQPFADCRLREVTAFLRCAYDQHGLAEVSCSCLLGVLHLAHRLDAPKVLAAVGAHMSAAAETASPAMPKLLAWAEAADTCQQEQLRVTCLIQVVRQLAVGMDSLADTSDFLAAASIQGVHLERCNKRSLLTLLHLMTAAARGAVPQEGVLLDSCASSSSADAVLSALQPGSTGGFEWTLERFSEQPAAVGGKVESPWFAAAGRLWSIRVHPGGVNAFAGGRLSVFLMPKLAVRAKYKLTVVDQSGTASQSVNTLSVNEPMEFSLEGRGFPKFMTLEQLRTRGYLANDRLVVRAEVEVVPE